MSVTYIFVQIRKILEKNMTESLFPLISFYANWVVHPKLDRKEAQRELGYFDKKFEEANCLLIDFPIIDETKDFIDFSKLKEQLRSFFDKYNLPKIILDEPCYTLFLDNLINILSDCSLEATEGHTFIERFSFEPQRLSGDVSFIVLLNNGLSYHGTTNFNYLNHKKGGEVIENINGRV